MRRFDFEQDGPVTGRVFRLQEFPLVIDPLTPALEVLLARLNPGATDFGPAGWVQLERVRVRHNSFPDLALDTGMVHFFGPSRKVRNCPFLLVYDAGGRLRGRILRESDGRFHWEKLPAEATGQVGLRPSVRLTFAHAGEAARFVAVLNQIRQGQAGAEAVAVLGQLLELTPPPALIPVAHQHTN